MGLFWGGVGVTLGSLSAYKGDFGSLWCHFTYTKVVLGRSWCTFRALGRHFGDTLASLLVHFSAALVDGEAILERNFASFLEQEKKTISKELCRKM